MTRLHRCGRRARAFRCMTTLAFAAAAPAAASPAFADDAREDATRFRGGIQAELGPAVFFTNGHASFAAGLTGHVGVQLGKTFGLVFAPQIQAFMGQESGPYVGGAFLGDVTIDDRWALGLGPEMGVLVPDGDGGGPTTGPNVGLIGRFALYPEADPGTDGRRSGVVVGLDLHARLTGVAYAACGGCGPDGPPLALLPMLFVGHAAY